MTSYIVKPGDTLYSIAQRSSIPIALIITANPQLKRPYSLTIGETIRIPELQPVPKQLADLESNAEDIMDDLYKSDWSKATSKLNAIKINMTELEPILHKSSVPDKVIREIENAIKLLSQEVEHRNARPAVEHANHITRFLPDVFDYFQNIVPTDIGRLDYLGREIIVNVEKNDWKSVGYLIEILKKIWERTKVKLSSSYSKDIEDFETAQTKLEEGADQQDYQMTITWANKILDQVDTLENDFQKQKAVPAK